MEADPVRCRNSVIPAATIERLSVYRRWLEELQEKNRLRVFSHEFAGVGQVTAAQVRRDLMQIGFGGSPAHGYQVPGLLDRISELLEPSEDEGVILVGLGQLGRVLLKYLTTRRPSARFVAAFDIDPSKTGGVLLGVPCYPMDQLEDVVRQRGARVGVLTIPASAAQDVAQRLAGCGVYGILNFAPVRLRAPDGLFVQNVDIATLLETAAYFARRIARPMEAAT
jgi:redox-sensing transcriptional repressor